MLIAFILLLTAGLLSFFLLRRAGRLPVSRIIAAFGPPHPAGPAPYFAAAPAPPPFDEDLLELDDLQWALKKHRDSLEREKSRIQANEVRARINSLEDGLDAFEQRLQVLQHRMGAWKEALLELEELRTTHAQLQSEHLDLQYRAQSLQEAEAALRVALDESRRDTRAEVEDKEDLRRQLEVLRALSHEE